MATTPTVTSDRFKAQAKRLREFLAKSEKEISHSTALEAVALMHGYKDWNVASAATKEELKLFIVYCSFEGERDGEMGEFQYLVRAKSAQEVEAICAAELPILLKRSNYFSQGMEIELQDIFEVKDVSETGVVLNVFTLRNGSDEADFSARDRFSHALPTGENESEVKHHYWSRSDELLASNTYAPFIRL